MKFKLLALTVVLGLGMHSMSIYAQDDDTIVSPDAVEEEMPLEGSTTDTPAIEDEANAPVAEVKEEKKEEVKEEVKKETKKKVAKKASKKSDKKVAKKAVSKNKKKAKKQEKKS